MLDQSERIVTDTEQIDTADAILHEIRTLRDEFNAPITTYSGEGTVQLPSSTH